MPGEYLLQMQWQMACTGRAWCDWVSFEPRLPAHLQLHVRRMHRDEQLISGMEQQAIEFLAELDRMVARLEPHRRAA
jgi:hypothetical protein